MAKVIEVDDRNVRIALGRFRLALGQKWELMRQIGAMMLVSVRRTFRTEGVPSGSWPGLAPSTIKSNPKLYGRGHKLLVLSGRLLNSISFRTTPGTVVIGTNLKYAAVHQFGSRDFGFGARTAEQAASTVKVGAHSYSRISAELGTGKLAGRKRRIAGPRNSVLVNVIAHRRHQNIPPRPYLVFRPEDPGRIRALCNRFVASAKQSAGLAGEA